MKKVSVRDLNAALIYCSNPQLFGHGDPKTPEALRNAIDMCMAKKLDGIFLEDELANSIQNISSLYSHWKRSQGR